LPEPLCAIWEPTAREPLLAYVASSKQCPRKFLINAPTKLLDLPDARALDNINTGAEFQAASEALAPSPRKDQDAVPRDSRSVMANNPISLRIQYYALFREQAGRSEETIDTRASTPAELYRELQARYPFQLAPAQLKVAVNADFRDWNAPLTAGDTVVFIPPVAGG
jgi:molybdopterin converting factor subunit 1